MFFQQKIAHKWIKKHPKVLPGIPTVLQTFVKALKNGNKPKGGHAARSSFTYVQIMPNFRNTITTTKGYTHHSHVSSFIQIWIIIHSPIIYDKRVSNSQSLLFSKYSSLFKTLESRDPVVDLIVMTHSDKFRFKMKKKILIQFSGAS